MINKDSAPLRVILYEGNGSHPLPGAVRFDLMKTLLQQGYAVTRVTLDNSANRAMSFGESTLFVLGSFVGGAAPRAEDAEGKIHLEFRDITGLDGEAVLNMVELRRGDRPMNQPGKWKPWFPVIDYSRCTNCMQCLSFCLFDVYGVSEDQKIQVQNQDNCKTNCPACSRVCPEVAIMFPKYSAGPINGAEINPQDLEREKMKVDISALLGGDIYARLRERSEKARSRFSKERDSNKALKERQRCLIKLQSENLIPPEVLASLPSPEEIQRKAKLASEKAQMALASKNNTSLVDISS